MAYKIVQKVYGTFTTFQFWDDAISTDVPVATNPINTLLVDQYNRPEAQFHFKTFETGANIFKKQEIVLGDLIIEDNLGTQYTPATIDEVWSRLVEIDFFGWTGSGGGSSATAFTQLSDTFLYPGRALQGVAVNESETGLTTVPLFNKRFMTELDDVDQEPLIGANVGKRWVVGLDGNGEPKTMLADDNSNTPQSPNQITFADIQKTGDNEITLFADGVWLISGVQYSNALDIVRNVPYAEEGKRRLDAGYLDAENNFLIQTGVEVDVNENAILPTIPANTLLATIIDVTDSTVSSEPEPDGVPWVTKASQGIQNVWTSGSYYIPRTSKTHYVIREDSIIRGFSTAYLGTEEYYSGKTVRIFNYEASVLLKHADNEDGIPLHFYNGEDFVLSAGQTAEFFYNTAFNRFDYVGAIGGAGVSETFDYPFDWSTGDSLTFDIEDESRKVMSVYIDGAIIFKSDGLWTQDGAEITLDPSVEDLYMLNEVNKVKILGNGPAYDPTPPSERTVDNTIDLTVN